MYFSPNLDRHWGSNSLDVIQWISMADTYVGIGGEFSVRNIYICIIVLFSLMHVILLDFS